MKVSRYQKDRLKAASNRKVVSRTMNKIKPISKGGTRITSATDQTLAILEMNWEMIKIQRSVHSLSVNKANVEWRASPNVYL